MKRKVGINDRKASKSVRKDRWVLFVAVALVAIAALIIIALSINRFAKSQVIRCPLIIQMVTPPRQSKLIRSRHRLLA